MAEERSGRRNKNDMNFDVLHHPLEMILIYVFLVLSFGMHEAAHAKVAGLFGDTQPAEDGFDTWNPIPHIRRSIFSSLIIPAITWFLFRFFIGGALTRLNPENMKPRRMGYALAVASGPLMNLAIAVVAGILTVVVALVTRRPTSSAVVVLLGVGSFNFFGFIFNMLPFPPLDGSAVIRAVFPRTERFFRLIQGFPILLIFIIGMQFPAFASVLFFPIQLYNDALWALVNALHF
jgi:Zn-dependent protease